jgi:hypothetical protein
MSQHDKKIIAEFVAAMNFEKLIDRSESCD